MGFGDKTYFEGARVYHDADQEIPEATHTILAFNSERWDTDSIHDPTTNNSRLTCKTAGKYLISANIAWQKIGVVFRQLRLKLNGSTIIASVTQLPCGTYIEAEQSLTTIYDLSVDDYLEVEVNHFTGAAMNVLSLDNFSPEFMMQRIG